MQKVLKTILASSMGNTVEFFSLTLFGGLVYQIGNVFFPESDHKLILSLCVYGCSYIMRPLGGLLLGSIGDRKGRSQVLTWSVGVVGFSNLIVAFLPGYATIGNVSVAILVACRLLQGVCLGAEYSGALTFGQEHVSKEHRAKTAGWISGSCFWGFALGLIFTQVAEFLPSWGWRLGFIISALMTFVALFLRKGLGETPEFLSLDLNAQIKRKVINWKETMRVFVLACMDGTATYTLGGFVFVYLTQYIGLDANNVLPPLILFVIITGFLCVGFALLTERVPVMRIVRYGLWLGTLLVPPCFSWVSEDPTFLSIITLFSLLAILTGLFVGIQPILMYKLVPVERRMATVSFGYNVGLAITGGLLPAAFAVLVEHTNIKSMPGHVLGAIYFFLLYGAKRIVQYLKTTHKELT